MNYSGGESEGLNDTCGVNFEPWDDPVQDDDTIECADGDLECLERRRKSLGSEASRKSDALSESRSKTTMRSLRLSMASGGITRDPPYEGLPPDYYKKYYRPDYPDDLQMVTGCAPTTHARRTAGISKSHPKAIFVPSDPTLMKRASAESRKSGASTKKEFAFMNEPSPLEQNRLPPPIISSSDEIIVDWLEEHNIQMMFEYLLALCVIAEPPDPWTFIADLCDQMIEARNDVNAFEALPRILTPDHTEAVFRIYDRIENGFITLIQYKSAMDAMGLNRFSLTPAGWEENAISKDTFIKEATVAIDDLLKSFMTKDLSGQTIQDSTMVSEEGRQSKADSQKTNVTKSGQARTSENYSSKSGDDSDMAYSDNQELTFF